MRRWLCLCLVFVCMSGCSGENRELNRCMALRERLLVEGCAFTGNVTADFGDKSYSFSMKCSSDAQGTLSFSVISPEEISGIGGSVKAGKGKLEYEDTVLAFPLLAEGELTPVSGPWLLITSLRSGYLAFCGLDGEYLRVTIHDSYAEDALVLEVWLDKNDCPVRAEVFWRERRVLSMDIKDFQFV